MFTVIKRLTKIGNGTGVIIPQSFLENLEWKENEQIALVYNKNHIKIEQHSEEIK